MEIAETPNLTQPLHQDAVQPSAMVGQDIMETLAEYSQICTTVLVEAGLRHARHQLPTIQIYV